MLFLDHNYDGNIKFVGNSKIQDRLKGMTRKRQHNDDFDAEDILSQSMIII